MQHLLSMHLIVRHLPPLAKRFRHPLLENLRQALPNNLTVMTNHVHCLLPPAQALEQCPVTESTQAHPQSLL
jgi:hypothetical protein